MSRPAFISTPLIINHIPDDRAYHDFSEQNLIHLPDTTFTINTSNPGFDNFAVHTLTIIFQYLLLAGVLRCSNKLKEYCIFNIVYFRRFVWLFEVNEDAAVNAGSWSWLEETIIDHVRDNTGGDLKQILSALLDGVIGHRRYACPGKLLVHEILGHQKEPVVTTSIASYLLFWEKMTVDTAALDQGVDNASYRVRELTDRERSLNPAFDCFSDELLVAVAAAMTDKTIQHD